jgi:hypothetical protein
LPKPIVNQDLLEQRRLILVKNETLRKITIYLIQVATWDQLKIVSKGKILGKIKDTYLLILCVIWYLLPL